MKHKFKIAVCIISFFFASHHIFSQVSGDEFRSTALNLIDNLELKDKILFIHVWQSTNVDSRENNKEFLRVSNIYQVAKLKNGAKGVAFVNISLDKDAYNYITAIKKDSIVSNFSLDNLSGKYNSLLKLFGDYTGSVVVGSDGTIIAKDLKKENCFNLFRSLITR